MRDYVQEHLEKHKELFKCKHRVIPVLKCKDGVEYSIQASEHHYCTPREFLTDPSTYLCFEVWRHNSKRPSTDPEGWVSRRKLNNRIHRHGGIKKQA